MQNLCRNQCTDSRQPEHWDRRDFMYRNMERDRNSRVSDDKPLTYYDKMNADEKILTLKNRANVLAQKQEQMME